MSELFDKSIRTLELPRVLQMLADQAVSAEAQDPGAGRAAGDGTGGGPAPSGPDRRGPDHDWACGEVPPFPVSSRWPSRWTGRTGAADSTPGSADIADLLTAARRAKEIFQRRRGGKDRH